MPPRVGITPLGVGITPLRARTVSPYADLPAAASIQADFFSILAQVSLSVSVRLKTSAPGPESGSTQK